MNESWWWAVGALATLLGGVLLNVVANEVSAWLPSVARRLLTKAAARLPERQRHASLVEWNRELDEIPGGLWPLRFALARWWASRAKRDVAHRTAHHTARIDFAVSVVPSIAASHFVSQQLLAMIEPGRFRLAMVVVTHFAFGCVAALAVRLALNVFRVLRHVAQSPELLRAIELSMRGPAGDSAANLVHAGPIPATGQTESNEHLHHPSGVPTAAPQSERFDGSGS